MSNKYLANGTIIGGHYEIIDVLGEDDFEILYLVRNIHRRGSFFVIKELFLEVFSERKGNSVETIPEAQGVFNKRKAEIRREIDNLPRRHIECEIKVFAYFEENGTIYSCMAYTPNAKVEDYLQFEPKEDVKLPLLEELTQTKKEKKHSPILLIGVALSLLIGGLILAYNQYGDKLKTLNIWSNNGNKHIELNSTQEKNSTKRELKQVLKIDNSVVHEKKILAKKREELLENNSSNNSFSNSSSNSSMIDTPKKEIKEEENLSVKKIAIKDKLEESNITKNIIKETNVTKKIVDDNITKVAKKENKESSLNEIFSEKNIRQFLNNYMQTTAHSSSKKIMKLYDNKISRYFQFKNITPKRVGKSVRIYNRKWKHRSFKLLNFKILKRYRKNGVNYCNIRTRTKWYVSNSRGKRKSGYSKGFMTIKDTKDGFRVKAIYGIK